VTKYKPAFVAVTERISDELDKLATKGSPAQIAAYLATQNATGQCRNSVGCPVYHVLARAIASKFLFKVSTNATHIWTDGLSERVSLVNPLPVADFIAAFDAHRFPELEQKK
jgi:hypothetical protein